MTQQVQDQCCLCEDVASIPGLDQGAKDPVLPWLWLWPQLQLCHLLGQGVVGEGNSESLECCFGAYILTGSCCTRPHCSPSNSPQTRCEQRERERGQLLLLPTAGPSPCPPSSFCPTPVPLPTTWAPIPWRPLAWEPPYAAGTALKKSKEKKKYYKLGKFHL